MINLEMTILGIGYSGFSGGEMEIKIYWNDFLYVFNAPCQNTSGSGIGFGPIRMKNDIADEGEGLLTGLNNYIVQVDIPTAFIGWGKIDFTFQVFKSDSSEPIFKTNRKVDAVGCSLGEISILTTPKLLRKGMRDSSEMRAAQMQEAYAGFM